MNYGGHLQQVCELRIILWDAYRIILVTPSGRQVVVEAPPGHPTRRVFQEFQWSYTVKDLGIHARILMGVEGYTPLRQTTRIWHQGRPLPMHQPVVTLCPRAEWHNTAHHFCTFCHYGLENKQGELGPFEGCWFCLDRPAWHHGHCCPHNSASREWNGIPHLRLYRSSAQWEPPTWTEQDPNPHQDSREFRSWLRTLPF